MKKTIVIIGMALVILVGCIGFMAVGHNDNKSAVELVAEAYLIQNHGDGNYAVEINKIEDGVVYFFWDDGDHHCGYTHTTLASINGNS